VRSGRLSAQDVPGRQPTIDGSAALADGQLPGRAQGADKTFCAYEHLMKPAGITRLADITGLDIVGIPVFIGVRPLAKSLVISVGKGTSRSSARAGALMEAIECWYAEDIAPDLRQIAFRELSGAMDPATLPLALDWTGEDMSAWRADWVRGADLRTGQQVWVPFDVVSLDFRCDRLGVPWLARNSNGLASGNNRAEAVLHGLSEVVERDAEWRWRAGSDSRRLDLGTVTDTTCRDVIDRIERAGVQVAAWDVSSYAGLPCFGCVMLSDPERDIWGCVGVHDGFACHPHSGAALAAALLEAAQKRLTYISGSRDDVTRAELARASSPDLTRLVRDELESEPATYHFGWIATAPPGLDAAAYQQLALDALAQADCPPPVVVDVASAPDEPAVVKVIVPGMYGPHGSCAAPQRVSGPDGSAA